MNDSNLTERLGQFLRSSNLAGALIFSTDPSDDFVENVLAISPKNIVLTYRNTIGTKWENHARVKSYDSLNWGTVLSDSAGATIILCQWPRLEHLACLVGSLIRGRYFRLIWLTVTGPKSYSLVRLGFIYLTIRLSNLPSKRMHHILEWCFLPKGISERLGRLLSVAPLADQGSVNSRTEVMLAFGSFARGGAERQILKTALCLSGIKEYNVSVICADLSSGEELRSYLPELHAGQIDVREAREDISLLPGPTLKRLLEFNALFESVAPDLTELVTRLACEIERTRPAVVHSWLDGTNVAAGIAGVISNVPRVLLGCRNVNPSELGLNRHYMRLLYKCLLRTPNVYLVNNSIAGATDYDKWLGEGTKSPFVIPNGVQPVNISAIGGCDDDDKVGREIYEFTEGKKVVGTVARFADQKNPFFWVSVAEQILVNKPDVRFVMVGDGPLLEKTRRLIKRKGLQDKFLLPGQTAKVEKVYKQITCFLLTSSQEGLPNVLLEAQAAGIPVVTSRVGGAPEAVLDGKTGRVIEGREVIRYSKTVLEILDDESFLCSVKEVGPRFVLENFSMSKMIEKTCLAYTR